MARRQFRGNSGKFATGTTVKTVFSITAPANFGVSIDRLFIGFYGAPTATEPNRVVMRKGTLSGGAGSSGVTLVRTGGVTGNPQATAAANYGTNPTGGSTIFDRPVHPSSSYTAPEPIWLDPGESLMIDVTCPAANDCSVNVNCEE